MAGVFNWHGERSARYGTQKLWLEFAEYPDERIIAVRHEKTADDGVVWDSDFILKLIYCGDPRYMVTVGKTLDRQFFL